MLSLNITVRIIMHSLHHYHISYSLLLLLLLAYLQMMANLSRDIVLLEGYLSEKAISSDASSLSMLADQVLPWQDKVQQKS